MTNDFKNTKVILVRNKRKAVRDLNTNKLKGRIVEIFGSQRKFAEHIGKSEITVTKKLSGASQFSLNDITEWCNALDIQSDEVGLYFFANELQKH